MTGNSKPKNKFGKLLKHDFLASARVISLFYIAEAICLILYKVCYYLTKNTTNPGDLVIKLINFTPWSIIICCLIAFALIVLTIFYIIFDFFKSLYSPQGYLSFTLPVTSNQLLASKILVYGGWMVVSFLVFVFIGQELTTFSNEFLVDKVGQEQIDVISMILKLPSLNQIVAYVICFVFNVLITMFLFVSTAYFTISVSHMRWFQKSSVLWSILLFFPIFLTLSAISSIPSKFIQILIQFKADGSIGLGIADASEKYSLAFDLSGMIANVIECVGLFFATSYVMHKKVNIK